MILGLDKQAFRGISYNYSFGYMVVAYMYFILLAIPVLTLAKHTLQLPPQQSVETKGSLKQRL